MNHPRMSVDILGHSYFHIPEMKEQHRWLNILLNEISYMILKLAFVTASMNKSLFAV